MRTIGISLVSGMANCQPCIFMLTLVDRFATQDALREIHRVLQPGAVFGMIWNIEDYNKPVEWEASTKWEQKLNDFIWSLDDGLPRFRHLASNFHRILSCDKANKHIPEMEGNLRKTSTRQSFASCEGYTIGSSPKVLAPSRRGFCEVDSLAKSRGLVVTLQHIEPSRSPPGPGTREGNRRLRRSHQQR
jgi:hypothetical protein